MAQDSMRPGPRGSSDQEAYVGPKEFVVYGPTTAFNLAKATGQVATPRGSYFEGDYEGIAIEIRVTTTFATNDCSISVGTAAATTAIVNAFASGSATTAAGTVKNVPLNGAAIATTFGATNGPIVVTNNASAGAGAYQVSILAKPVSGTYFNNK